MNNREVFNALTDGGMNSDDAYDLLADQGLDPHPDAPVIQISGVAGRRKGGRPRIGRPVELTLPDDDIAFLDAKAREFGISRAEVVRRMIDWWRDKRL